MKKNNQYPQNNNQKNGAMLIRAEKQEIRMYQGPLPSPEVLERYEEIAPGTAERLVNQMIKQSDHRMNIENKVIDSKISDSKIGMYLGFILGAIALLGGFYLISTGKGGYGIGVIITSIGTLVVSFIYATKSNRDERKDKRDKGSE